MIYSHQNYHNHHRQRDLQNPAKHLNGTFLRKQLTALAVTDFQETASFESFDRVLNMPQTKVMIMSVKYLVGSVLGLFRF